MKTQFVTSLVMLEDGFEAGKEVAQLAVDKIQPRRSPHLVILFCSDKYEYAAVLRGVKQIVGETVPVIGCSSAGQFSDEGVYKRGLSCAMIVSDDYQFFTGVGINIKSDPLKTVEHAVKAFPKEVEGYPYQAAILFIDGLAGKGEETVLAASSLLGPDVKFAGAAAADNLNFRETVVFGNGHVLTNAMSACLLASRSPIIISCKHGHKPISQPLTVTKAKDNVIYEFDQQPALDVWKNHVRKHLKGRGVDVDQLNSKELSNYLLEYEVGLMTGPDSDYKIRFPASCNPDGSLNFTCSMMEGSVVKIMDSSQQDQIDSARQAAEMALHASKGVKLAGAVIFDCACRAMILQEQFSQAVKAKQEVLGALPFIGGETYGEIAMDAGQYSGFHNTTTVIMLFPE